MGSVVNIALRGLQIFWTFLIIALVGNIIHDAKNGNPSIINYVMFVAVISAISLIYLFIATIKEAFAVPMYILIIDALNVLFFFCGAVALAAGLKVRSCSDEAYLKSNHITNGSDNMMKRCREAQAVTAFLWFAFVAYVGSLVFSLLGAKGSSVPMPSVIRSRGAGRV